MKSQQNSGIRYLQVPKPTSNWQISETDITNIKCHTRVDNPIDIFNTLLRQNFKQLLKSDISEFSKGHLKDKIGWNAETDYVSNLLDGVNEELIEDAFAQGNYILNHFIQAIKKPKNNKDQPIQTLEWTFGIEEYRETFSKTCEHTVCRPSGLHMSHWKIALKQDCIMRVHSFFIWAAFAFIFSYPRWEVSWHCTLRKKITILPKTQNYTIV